MAVTHDIGKAVTGIVVALFVFVLCVLVLVIIDGATAPSQGIVLCRVTSTQTEEVRSEMGLVSRYVRLADLSCGTFKIAGLKRKGKGVSEKVWNELEVGSTISCKHLRSRGLFFGIQKDTLADCA